MDFRRLRSLAAATAIAASAGAVAGLCGGCAAEVYPPTVGGYTAVYATSVPNDMARYPRVAYGSNYAYLVNNRWYYPYGSRWVVLQREPPELYRYRTTYVARPAPPRPYPPSYAYPPRYTPAAPYGYPAPPR